MVAEQKDRLKDQIVEVNCVVGFHLPKVVAIKGNDVRILIQGWHGHLLWHDEEVLPAADWSAKACR